MAKFTLTYNAKSKSAPVSLTYESSGSLVTTSTQQDNIKAKFTKTYNVKPNANQIKAISLAFKDIAQHLLYKENKDVEVVTSLSHNNHIIATLIVNGENYQSRIIGPNGGLRAL